MFQFTTTNVLNSLKDLTTGKDLITVIATSGSEETRIKRVGNFKKVNVQDIYYTPGSEAELAAVCFDMTGLEADGKYRLNLYIGLTQGSADSRYANDLYHKGKAFSIDFVADADAAKTAENLVNILNKYDILVYGDRQLKASAKTKFVAIEAVNEYQRFVRANIEKLDPNAYFEMGDYKVVKGLDKLTKLTTHDAVVKDGAPVAEGKFVGKEGFGTYSYLLHNLRLPTDARSGAFAWNKEESPVPGVIYDEYVLHYCADRGELGMNAVGDTVKSVTTHVFYVPNTLATEFQAAMKNLGSVMNTATKAALASQASTGGKSVKA